MRGASRRKSTFGHDDPRLEGGGENEYKKL